MSIDPSASSHQKIDESRSAAAAAAAAAAPASEASDKNTGSLMGLLLALTTLENAVGNTANALSSYIQQNDIVQGNNYIQRLAAKSAMVTTKMKQTTQAAVSAKDNLIQAQYKNFQTKENMDMQNLNGTSTASSTISQTFSQLMNTLNTILNAMKAS
jgi:hypothetical protein